MNRPDGPPDWRSLRPDGSEYTWRSSHGQHMKHKQQHVNRPMPHENGPMYLSVVHLPPGAAPLLLVRRLLPVRLAPGCVEINQRVSYLINIARTFTASSRRGHGDNVASMA